MDEFAGWTLGRGLACVRQPEGPLVEPTGPLFHLLVVFVTYPQRWLNRDQLLDWTRGRSAMLFDRTIDVQLSRLRRKLGDDPREPALILTVRGGGYLPSLISGALARLTCRDPL